ncbi:MAG: hypothetical protein A2Y79_09795 [Deltaproteobacteria bacterium RBG_13_43_22]|nr:MAG: hypothetical protein A2Y79_09795 [Deltaproteobacteria bacterium RBG_13_43_22]
MTTELAPASHNDSLYLPLCAAASCHTEQPIKIIYADKGYFGEPNRTFLSLNQIKDGIMRKDTTTAKFTEYEKERNKKISKKRYIIEQYFGFSHLHQGAYRHGLPVSSRMSWMQCSRSIKGGMAIHVRWVKSAVSPKSTEKIEEEAEARDNGREQK